MTSKKEAPYSEAYVWIWLPGATEPVVAGLLSLSRNLGLISGTAVMGSVFALGAGTRELIDTCTFSYTRQVEMKGLGHAILSGRPLIGDEPFAVVLADDLCVNPGGDPVLLQMIELYRQFRCSIVAIQEVPREETHKYGVIAGEMIRDDLYRVSHMVEKPKPEEAPSNLAIIGRYILTPDIFQLIADTEPGKGGEIQITDALMKQARQGAVLAYKFKGQRFDCGSAEGYVEATNYCFEQFYKKEQ